MSNRLLPITSCRGCPHFRTSGGFSAVSHVPKCTKKNKTIEYDVSESRGIVGASMRNAFPSWCPLPKENAEREDA